MMYDNLKRLTVTHDTNKVRQSATDEELNTFVSEYTDKWCPNSTPKERIEFGAGMGFGILIGLCYAAEFGIPDIAKNFMANLSGLND